MSAQDVAAEMRCLYSNTEPSDEQLLVAFQHGDLLAYEALDRRYRPRLTGYVQKRLDIDMREATDDIVQATLVYLYRKAALFVQPNTFVQNILFKRAFRYIQNLRRDWFRQRRDRSRTLLLSDKEPPPGKEFDRKYEAGEVNDPDIVDIRGADRQAARQEVREYLGLLMPAESQIIQLIYIDGHTAKSAAETLHVSMTTAQWRYRKAWEHLRQIAQRTT